MQIEAHLQYPRENLQIPYPQGFQSRSKTNPLDENIIAGAEPRFYSAPEIEVVEKFLPNLPYAQSLIKTGAVLIGDDALLGYSHDQLDEIESAQDLPNTRLTGTAAERAIRERVFIIREQGYFGVPSVTAVVATVKAEPVKSEAITEKPKSSEKAAKA